ncbi:hypothetical protein JMM81_07015 [Bacillus sp. V3B]|uniref:hypothetical protein n=1 Tax=Bacillus sp. V3B TaxID=2804915 RepID=UPI00210899D1|nr:hypothetical protein [Bacillus sp. V3B]MCQ6274722.1 hypothetical protein [Bacillus sp. V3B]
MFNYLSREVIQLVNDVEDEIEFEIIRYHDHYSVTATICQEEPPFKDYIAFGKDRFTKRRAMKKALEELYLQAYPN